MKDLEKIDMCFKACYRELAEFKVELNLKEQEVASPELLGLHFDINAAMHARICIWRLLKNVLVLFPTCWCIG